MDGQYRPQLKLLITKLLEEQREEIKELLRALKVISKIAMNEDPDEKSPPWQDVYMISHSFSETCPHVEWRDVVDRVEKRLRDL